MLNINRILQEELNKILDKEDKILNKKDKVDSSES